MALDDIQPRYTNDDDGIHLWCTLCAWEKVLGHFVGMDVVMLETLLHMKECLYCL